MISFTDLDVPDDYNELDNFINSGTLSQTLKNSNIHIDKLYSWANEIIEHKKKIIENRPKSEFDTFWSDCRDLVQKINENCSEKDIKKIVKNLSKLKFDDERFIEKFIANISKSKNKAE